MSFFSKESTEIKTKNGAEICEIRLILAVLIIKYKYQTKAKLLR